MTRTTLIRFFTLFLWGTLAVPIFATESKTHLKTDGKKSEKRFCTTRIWGEYNIHASRCRSRDDVMVGVTSVSPLEIRCGILDVNCSDEEDTTASSATDSELDISGN